MGYQLADYPGKPNLWPQTFPLEKPQEAGHEHEITYDPAHTLGEDILGNTWRYCETCTQYHLDGTGCYPYKRTEFPGVVNIPTPFTSDPLPTSEPWTITTCKANDFDHVNTPAGSKIGLAGLTIGPGKISLEAIEDSISHAVSGSVVSVHSPEDFYTPNE